MLLAVGRCRLRDNSFSATLDVSPIPVDCTQAFLVQRTELPLQNQTDGSKLHLRNVNKGAMVLVKQCVTNLLSSDIHTNLIRGASSRIYTEILSLLLRGHEKTRLHLPLLRINAHPYSENLKAHLPFF
jgi:hypothetical protein